MRRIIKILICIMLIAGNGFAAEKPEAPYTIFLELLGNGGLYSINADYRFREDGSIRLGFVNWNAGGFFGNSESLTAFPLLANYLYGSGNSWLELGAGILYGHYQEKSSIGNTMNDYNFTTLTGSISYRYQRPNGGFFFKAGLTPLYPLGPEGKRYPTDGPMPWVGVSLGYSF